MNIKKELLKDRSKEHVTKIIHFIGDDKKLFEELLGCMKSSNDILQFRSSWALSISHDNKYSIVQKYAEYYMDILEQYDVKGIKRTILRVFQTINIPTKIHGRVINYTFKAVADPKESIAVRAFGLQVLYKMTLQYPDFKNEFLIVCKDIVESESGGLKSRACKLLKLIKKSI